MMFIPTLILGQEDKKEAKKPDSFSMKEKGFFSETAIGENYGNTSYGYKTNGFAFSTMGGYQYRDLAAGIGVGLENWFDRYAFPVFSSIRYYFSRGKTAPYISINGGYCFGSGSDPDPYNYDMLYYAQNENVMGPFGSAHFGIRRAFGKDFALVFSTGARYQNAKVTYYSYPLNQDVTEVSEYYRFEIRLGVYFN